jgi:predicted RNA-binding protein (virulence factor B family)
MLQIGKTQDLTLARLTSVGAYLTDGNEDVLLPRKYVPQGADLGQTIRAFVYLDSEDRPVATTRKPKAEADSFASLKCVDTNNVGAFMDWGLEKDLLVPFREQVAPMRAEQTYIVRIVFDEVSRRLIGSTRLRRFLLPPTADARPGTKIEFLVTDLRPRSVQGIADGKFAAAILDDELHQPMRVGQVREAWIKRVTEESLLLALRPVGRTAEADQAQTVVERLRQEHGFLNLTDDSSPDQIRKVLGLSKSSFKRIVGHLLRDGVIDLEPYGIRLRE